MMRGDSITISGAPIYSPPPPLPPEPENQDLSALRNMMENAIDDKERMRPKAGVGGGGSIPPGANAGDMLVWNGTAWIVLAKPAGLAILVAGADGIPVWLAATTKGILSGIGTTLVWLSSAGISQPGALFLSIDPDPDRPYWGTMG